MSTDNPQKLQDALIALYAPDLSTASVALVTAWNNVIKNGGITARGVCTANVATLGGAGSFAGVSGGSTTNTDGVTFVQGDTVLLASQTSALQNGLYTVGVVAAGTAPLTRQVLFPAGATLPGGLAVTVGGEGTVYKNTLWKSFSAAQNVVIGTTDPAFYPLSVSWQAALPVGATGIMIAGVTNTAGAPANMAVFSTNSYIIAVRKTATTCSLTTGGYHQNVAATPGVPGTGSVNVMACVAAGTVNTADTSTLFCTLVNQI